MTLITSTSLKVWRFTWNHWRPWLVLSLTLIENMVTMKSLRKNQLSMTWQAQSLTFLKTSTATEKFHKYLKASSICKDLPIFQILLLTVTWKWWGMWRLSRTSMDLCLRLTESIASRKSSNMPKRLKSSWDLFCNCLITSIVSRRSSLEQKFSKRCTIQSWTVTTKDGKAWKGVLKVLRAWLVPSTMLTESTTSMKLRSTWRTLCLIWLVPFTRLITNINTILYQSMVKRMLNWSIQFSTCLTLNIILLKSWSMSVIWKSLLDPATKWTENTILINLRSAWKSSLVFKVLSLKFKETTTMLRWSKPLTKWRS